MSMPRLTPAVSCKRELRARTGAARELAVKAKAPQMTFRERAPEIDDVVIQPTICAAECASLRRTPRSDGHPDRKPSAWVV
jgi:hypothetical protein